MEEITPPKVRSVRADLNIDMAGVSTDDERESLMNMSDSLQYKLPDPISALQDIVGLTRASLKRILEDSGRLDEYPIDPNAFITQVAYAISMAKTNVLARESPIPCCLKMNGIPNRSSSPITGKGIWNRTHSSQATYRSGFMTMWYTIQPPLKNRMPLSWIKWNKFWSAPSCRRPSPSTHLSDHTIPIGHMSAKRTTARRSSIL